MDCGAYWLLLSVGADDILQAQGVVLDDSRVRVKTETMSFDEQQRRASTIQDIESSDFIQSTFKSSRSEVRKLTALVMQCTILAWH